MTWTVAAVAFPWVVVILGVWVVSRFLHSSGSVMLRVASLENYLDELDDAIRELLPSSEPPQGLAPGSPAPAFELPDLEGRRVSLEQFRGRRVLLIFFSPGCSFCQAMAPSLAGLEAVLGEGAPLPLLITTGDPEANRALVGEHGIRFPVLLQEQLEVAGAYSATATPMGCLIDEQGLIASPLLSGADDVLRLAEVRSHAGNGNGAGSPGADAIPSEVLPRRVHWQKQTGLRPGVRAPYFLLPRLGGGRLSLKEYLGRRVLLVFTAPDCAACDRVMPALESLYGRSADFEMVVISRGDPEENRAKVSALGLTAAMGLQRGNDVSRLYRTFVTPAAYLIDEEGMIATEVAVGGKILNLAAQAAGSRPGQGAAPMTWRGSELAGGGS